MGSEGLLLSGSQVLRWSWVLPLIHRGNWEPLRTAQRSRHRTEKDRLTALNPKRVGVGRKSPFTPGPSNLCWSREEKSLKRI